MAYETKYRIQFKNEQHEIVVVEFKQRDGINGDVQEYAATKFKLAYDGSEEIDNCIFGLSLDVEFDIRADDVDYWNDFVQADHL